MFPPTIFITGTDTDVGKTIVSAIFTLGLGATYWKPVQSGCEPMTDTERVRSLTQLPPSHFLPEQFRLSQPLSPHAAAAIDGVAIALSDFQCPTVTTSHLIIEGAGGLMVPLNSQDYMIDLICQFQVPVCLVSRSTLGTINHTLLSLEQLRRYDIPVLGVVLNGPKNQDNREAIAHYGQVPILGELESMTDLSPPKLQQAFTRISLPPLA
ncbi:MAG: dethiobiotin synthase [Leptolyngbyaceae cyanobacterium]